VLLISSFGLEVQGFDKHFEFISLGIDGLKSVFADVFFIVEFGNLFFAIKLKILEFVPIVSSKFCEKIILLLTFLWLWVLNSLGKIKWKSQKLLSIGRFELLVTVELINLLLVNLKFIMKSLDKQIKRTWWQWLLGIVGLVDKSLKGNGITIGLFDLLWVAISEVLKTMDLTVCPEDVIFISTLSLELEFLLEIGIDRFTFSDSVKHLGLGEWTRCVNVKVVLNLLLRVSMTNTVFENTELADQVVIGQVAILSNTHFTRASIIKLRAEFWE